MSDDYEVGYGKPPKYSQFKPGQSGNPKGKPKKAKSMQSVVRKEAYSKISLTENGKRSKVTKVEALFKSMMAKGISGDTKAALIALRLFEAHLPPPASGAEDKAHLTAEELKVLKTNADYLGLLKDNNNG